MDTPNITLICDQPNDGYLALVFTDKGIVISSKCKQSNAYDGLIYAVSDLLVDMAEQLKSKPELNDDTMKDGGAVDEYIEALQSVYGKFMKDVKSRMITESTARQMEALGFDRIFANLIAEGRSKFPGIFKAVDNSDDSENEDTDSE